MPFLQPGCFLSGAAVNSSSSSAPINVTVLNLAGSLTYGMLNEQQLDVLAALRAGLVQLTVP